MPAESLEKLRLLRLKGVLNITQMSKNTFLEGVKSGRFKITPIKSGRCVFYLQSELEQLIQQLIADSTADSNKAKAA